MRAWYLCAALIGCSAPAVDPVHHTSAPDGTPPVITFVDAPSAATRNADGTYTLGFALSFVDDTEPVASLRFSMADSTSDQALGPADDQLTTCAVTLPPSTSAGLVPFTLTLVAVSGLTSAPYESTVLLQ